MTTTPQQHSPAPWKVRPSQDRQFRLEIVDAEGCTIAVLDASNEAGGGMEDDVTLQGDAAVIAAGPDLLAACQELQAWLPEDWNRYRRINGTVTFDVSAAAQPGEGK
ncbi:MAG: hypothetical protein NT031_05820 [Planctomycetota bacterium]|nr:hypothetical protein [Planctomycetota bacterium]